MTTRRMTGPRPALLTSAALTLCLGAALASASAAAAQEDTVGLRIRVSGEIRVRGEYDDRTAATAADATTLLRTRLGVFAAVSPAVRAFVQLSDSRAFGDEEDPLTDASADHLDMHQAYLEWEPRERIALRVGRQELAYADERLVGPVGWANVTRSFDALRMTYRAGAWTADLFAATVRERDRVGATGLDPRRNQGRDDDRAFFGAWATGRHFDLFWLIDRNGEVTGARDVDRHTFGGYYRGSAGPWSVHATGALQLGQQRPSEVAGATAQTIRAFLLSARVGHTIPGALRSTAAIQVDYLSGDSDPGDDTYSAFHTVFATNHPFYGTMDLFLDIPAQTGGAGLVDIIARGSATADRWKLHADVHRLLLAQRLAGDRAIGWEADVTVQRTLARGLKLVSGYSVFVPSDAVRSAAIALGAESLHGAYLQATVRF